MTLPGSSHHLTLSSTRLQMPRTFKQSGQSYIHWTRMPFIRKFYAVNKYERKKSGKFLPDVRCKMKIIASFAGCFQRSRIWRMSQTCFSGYSSSLNPVSPFRSKLFPKERPIINLKGTVCLITLLLAVGLMLFGIPSQPWRHTNNNLSRQQFSCAHRKNIVSSLFS